MNEMGDNFLTSLHAENGDYIGFCEKGHVDAGEFASDVLWSYERQIDPSKVQHTLARWVPWRDEDGDWKMTLRYPVTANKQGAFCATVCEFQEND